MLIQGQELYCYLYVSSFRIEAEYEPFGAMKTNTDEMSFGSLFIRLEEFGTS